MRLRCTVSILQTPANPRPLISTALLQANGIPFTLSRNSKFKNMLMGSIDAA